MTPTLALSLHLTSDRSEAGKIPGLVVHTGRYSILFIANGLRAILGQA
jgi:hypothetical protein